MDFLKELTHDFGQILKFRLCLFLDKLGPDFMFNDHVVRKNAILDYKNIGFA